MLKFRNKVYFNNFATYGLNNKRNFLKPPMCECGCGNKMYIVLESENDLWDFMSFILMEHECSQCAIFAVKFDGNCYAAIKSLDENEEQQVNILQSQIKNDMHMFSEIDGELTLHCYGLLIEEQPGNWMIQE